MTPKLRLRALRLHAKSSAGEVERVIHFTDGLNLLRADNTAGKSTALQAIIYALGLEGMLGPSQRVPLPHAMTDSIVIDGVDSRIVDSRVELEVENGRGEIISVERSVVSATRDRHLITVRNGGGLSGRQDREATDYFVRRKGAAQNSAGFHRFLASFLGLDLPLVTRMDGSEGPLYLETLFPYFFVEQKHGWSGIQARIPTYLGIRDVGKRSAEFILGLDVFERTLQRQRLRSNMSELEAEWQAASTQLTEAARVSRVVIERLPVRVQHGVEVADIRPTVAIGEKWVPLTTALTSLKAQLSELTRSPAPSTGEAVAGVELELARLDHELRNSLAVAVSLEEERGELERHRTQVSLRLDALREDLQRHKDAEVLQRFGSEHAHALLADHICPTCHQQVDDGSDISSHAMSAAESVEFIGRQISTFESMQKDHERVIRAITIRLESLKIQIRSFRASIRAAKDTLSAANSSPSIAEISRRLILENRITELESKAAELSSSRENLRGIGERWAKQKDLLSKIEGSELSESDIEKLSQVQTSLQEQLREYGFESLDPQEVEIEQSTYRPVHEGFDLGFDLSASDMIRVIWAYLFSMLRVGQQEGGNHLGLLVFDEPRQQETAHSSYVALLAQASSAGVEGAQVLFATSEPLESLEDMLGGQSYNLISLDVGEKLLQPVVESSDAQRKYDH